MGSALKRLKKNVNKQNHIPETKVVRRGDGFDARVHLEVLNNLRVITATVLHDYHGFGQQRLYRFDQAVLNCIDKLQSSGQHIIRDYAVVIQKEMGDKVTDVYKNISLEEKLILAKGIKPNGKHSIMVLSSDVNDMIVTYACFSYAILTKEFKFSRPAIRRLVEKVKYYIRTLYNFNQFALTVDMMTECLIDECRLEIGKARCR